jgi:hypothetical protein
LEFFPGKTRVFHRGFSTLALEIAGADKNTTSWLVTLRVPAVT